MPNTRCSRCLATIELRASGSACSSSRLASASSPWASRTSASRCSECASPAADPSSRCAALASASSAAARSRSPDSSAASPDQRAGERGGPPGPAPFRGPAQVTGQLQDLGVRCGPVQQVLGRAQVAVEDSPGHPRILPGPVQLGSHLDEPLIRTVREQAAQRDEIEHLPIALTREDQPLRLLRRDPGGVEVGGEERVLAPGQEDVGVVGAAVGAESVQSGRGRGEVARHDRAVRQPGPQPPRIRGAGPAQRFPVGRPGHRVADRGEQVGAQRQRPGPAGTGGVRPDRVDERQRVAVGADSGFRLGRPHQVRHGVRARAGRQEVVADPHGRRAQLDQAPGGVAVDLAAPVLGDVAGQRVPDEAMAEPVARARGLDDPRGQGVVEMAEGLRLGQPGQRDELVGVERRAGHRHPLEHLAGGRPQPGEHAGLQRRRPVRPGRQGSAPAMGPARRASSVTRNGTPRPRVVTSLTSSAGGSAT